MPISNKNCQMSIENSQVSRKNVQIWTKLAKFIAIIIKYQAKKQLTTEKNEKVNFAEFTLERD